MEEGDGGGWGEKKEKESKWQSLWRGYIFSEVKMTAVPPSTTLDFVIFAPTAHSFLPVTVLPLHSFYLVFCSACPPLPPNPCPTLSATPSPPLLLPFALPRPPTAVSLPSFHPHGPTKTSFRLLQMLKETNLSSGRGPSALCSRAERQAAEPLCRNDSSSRGGAGASTRGQSTHTALCAIPGRTPPCWSWFGTFKQPPLINANELIFFGHAYMYDSDELCKILPLQCLSL